jgi:hypothetical protein
LIQARTTTRRLEAVAIPPPIAPPKKAAALEGIWLKAARRRTGTATNPHGKVLPGQLMKSSWMQLWVQRAHWGAPTKVLVRKRRRTGLKASPKPLQGATLQASALNEMSARLTKARRTTAGEL